MGGKHDSSAYSNSTKDLGVTPTQDAGSKAFKTAAPKPVTTQAAGTNARTPFPRG
jgi:protocatechuate 3,4-dioxygenase beta subunit